MKKITLKIFAILAVACFSQAQTTSDNIVGYAKVTVNGGELNLVALNFTPSSGTVADIIGDQLPVGSTIHIWNKETGIYDTVNKLGRGGWGAATINLGDAFWLQPSGSSSHEVILSGDVNTAATNSSTIAAGIEATGLFFPVETTFGATDLSAALPVGSTIHIWDNASQSYDTYNKLGRGGWGSAASVVVGPTTGFWVQTVDSLTWDETRPFNF